MEALCGGCPEIHCQKSGRGPVSRQIRVEILNGPFLLKGLPFESDRFDIIALIAGI
jgi:hypothetical protein